MKQSSKTIIASKLVIFMPLFILQSIIRQFDYLSSESLSKGLSCFHLANNPALIWWISCKIGRLIQGVYVNWKLTSLNNCSTELCHRLLAGILWVAARWFSGCVSWTFKRSWRGTGHSIAETFGIGHVFFRLFKSFLPVSFSMCVGGTSLWPSDCIMVFLPLRFWSLLFSSPAFWAMVFIILLILFYSNSICFEPVFGSRWL